MNRFPAIMPPRPRISKAIKIINPNTMAEIKIANPPLGSPNPANEESAMPASRKERRAKEREEKKKKAAEEELERMIAEEKTKQKAAVEKAEKRAAEEEAERKSAEEEAKRKVAVEKAEKKAVEEEAERKSAKEEAKQKERQSAKEEAERKSAKDEAKRKVAVEKAEKKAAEEEAERKRAKEEAKRKVAVEKAEKKAAEEAERKSEEERVREEEAEGNAAEGKTAEAAAAANFLKEKMLQGEVVKNKDAKASPTKEKNLTLLEVDPNVPPPLVTLLRTRETLSDLSAVKYPPNVKAPNPANPESGKFRYDREFLMQFMDVCTKKPDTLLSNEEFRRTPSENAIRPTQKLRQPKKPSKQTPGSEIFQAKSGGKWGRSSYQVGAPTIPMEQVVPLKISENRWVPNLVVTTPVDKTELIPIDIVMRKVKALLNKLTLEKLDTISDQIVEFANQSVNETDGTTLQVVTQLIYESAINDSNFAAMYAQLVRKMLDKLSIDIKDKNNNAIDPTGKAITGGRLFRKYLLKLCQDQFECGWKYNPPKMNKNEDGTENPLFLSEYYIATKEKARGLGLITFFGELFKLEMLTERIMHEGIKYLLRKVADPVEEETESLCKLMTTIGKELDNKKAKCLMDIYFDLMGDLLKRNKLPKRIRFLIQDVIDLRSTRWVPRVKNAPTPLQPSMAKKKSAPNPPVPPQDGGWGTVLANFDKIAHRSITKYI